MATMILNAAQTTSVVRTSEGESITARGLRDGAQVSANWYESMALAGRVVGATMGSVTTPLTFLVSAANRPDAWIRVPDGTGILPLNVHVALEDFAGTDTEIDIRVTQNDIGNGTSSAATVGPQSLRGDSLFSSACVARQLATADTTAETNPISVSRRQISTTSAAANDVAAYQTFSREQMGFPVLLGPATLEVFIAATTTQATGYVIIQWIELPETFFT